MKEFKQLKPSVQDYRDRSYEECIFDNCDFSSSDFSDSLFEECVFKDCHLSNIQVNNTKFQNCTIRDSIVMGLDFSAMSRILLSINFIGCNLGHTQFLDLDLRKFTFEQCRFPDTMFVNCDMTGLILDGADLESTLFENCILKKCDFTTAKNYKINPSDNDVKDAKFTMPDVLSFLTPLGIVVEGI